jgi:phenylalanyl-tRNA synthetase beta subunit
MVEKILNEGSISFLNNFALVNTFEGKGIADELISMTLSFTFQSPNKSLKDREINDSMTHVLRVLKKSLGAEIRS